MTLLKGFLASVVIAFWLLGLPGCFLFSNPDKQDMDLASKYVVAKDYKLALQHYTKIVKRNQDVASAVRAAQEASRIALFEIKDYQAAIGYFDFLILHSPDAEERKDAQFQIGKIYFKYLVDYPKAIEEFSKLLVLVQDKPKQTEIHMNIAKSYFYMKQFDQALSETDQIEIESLDDESKYSLYLLKANIYLAMNQMNEAVELYTKLMSDYPTRAIEDQVGMNLSVCYEELGDFVKAIEILKNVKPHYSTPEFVDIRIKRLQERKLLQPGARGLRK